TACFPQAVAFRQEVRGALPAVVLESFEVTDGSGAGNAPAAQNIATTVNWYVAPNGGSAPLCPTPDFAAAFVEVCNLSDGRARFTRVALNVENAARASEVALRTSVRIEALAQSDIRVAEYVGRLQRSSRMADVNLVLCENAEVAGRTLRRFVLEFRL